MKRGIFCIFIGLSCYLFLFFLSKELSNEIPAGIEVSLAESNTQTLYDLLQKNSPSPVEGISKKEKGTIGTNLEVANFLPTSPGYGDAIDLSYTEGSYFSINQSKNSLPYGVIPESLRLHLYGAEKAVGTTLLFEGISYEICGVYEDNRFLSRFSKNDLPLIYINLPLKGDLKTTNIHSLFIKNEAEKPTALILQESSAYLNLDLSENEAKTKTILSLLTLRQLGKSILQIGLASYGLFFVFLLFYISYKHSMTYHFLYFLSFFALALLLLFALFSQISIPPQCLPPDNLFDIAFYKQQLTTLNHQIKAIASPENFATQSILYLKLETILLLIGTPIFWIGCALTTPKCRRR